MGSLGISGRLISSTDLVKDHLESFRTCVLWKKTQLSGRATDAIINHSLLPQGPANGWNAFVLKLGHICYQKEVEQFAHKSFLHYKREHLKEYQTSREG